MLLELDGAQTDDMAAFLCSIAEAVGAPDGYFGWDLHSLRDCLQGGYGGEPPFEIVIRNAEAMISNFGHAALVAYAEEMLRVISDGGRGLVDESAAPFWESTRAAALEGEGPTLLDLLLESVTSPKSSIVLLDAKGVVLK